VIDFSRNHFELLELPARFGLDPAALDAAYRKLQTAVHPDRFAQADSARQRLAMQASARVNEAYAALRDPVTRAQYLLRLNGVEAAGETDTALPMEFLECQLTRREAAEAALAAGDDHALSALLDAVRAQARTLEASLTRELDQARAYGPARMAVRELTFLAKLAQDLDAMLAALDER
jgi:molecular chaperone HscB